MTKVFTCDNIITFHYLISLSVSEGLDMRLMDVIIAYLYGMLENDIYMKVPEGSVASSKHITTTKYVLNYVETIITWLKTIWKNVV